MMMLDERFVRVKQAVPAGEDVAFEPAFERVFAEHFHHAAIGGDVRAVGVLWLDLGKPRFQGGFIDILQAIRRILVGTEYSETTHVFPHHVAQKFAQRFGR